MTTIARLVLAAALAAAPAATAQVAGDVVGRWATPGLGAVVELSHCADVSTLCGTIRWLWDAVDEKGRPRLDAQNTDASLRGRPLVGLVILSGLKARRGGGWEGQIYNPEDGQTYRAIVGRRGGDTLVVEGCVLFVCREQVWRRTSALAEALGRI